MMKAIILTLAETKVWNGTNTEARVLLHEQIIRMAYDMRSPQEDPHNDSAPNVSLLGRDDEREPLYDLDWRTLEEIMGDKLS